MGMFTALACILSYVAARLHPIPEPQNFEEWVTNPFGAKLYRMFFQPYTEKVWGCLCTQIGADWAAQRIKGLSVSEAIRNAIFGPKQGKVVVLLCVPRGVAQGGVALRLWAPVHGPHRGAVGESAG
jgi:protoporphyrinogen oxidase